MHTYLCTYIIVWWYAIIWRYDYCCKYALKLGWRMPGTVNHTELTIIDSENYTEIVIVRLIISNIDKSGQCPGTKVHTTISKRRGTYTWIYEQVQYSTSTNSHCHDLFHNGQSRIALISKELFRGSFPGTGIFAIECNRIIKNYFYQEYSHPFILT